MVSIRRFSRYFIPLVALSIFVDGLYLTIKGVLQCHRYIDEIKHKNEIISELRPHVEWADGEAGISFEDQVDLAIRAEFPTKEIMEGKPINFHRLSESQLKKALESYKSE